MSGCRVFVYTGLKALVRDDVFCGFGGRGRLARGGGVVVVLVECASAYAGV